MTDFTAAENVRVARKPGARAGAGEKRLSTNALLDVLLLAVLSGVLVALWILFQNGGWEYYRTPLGVRGYLPAHRVLRPSGAIGSLLGIVGTLFMVSTLPYVARKRVKWLANVGSMKGWLEFHIFCGVFGPILITLHTSFRFRGIISVAYWSMLLVVASGFVGRYLFVRIPKTIRGVELTKAELEGQLEDIRAELLGAGLPAHVLQRIDAIDAAARPAENEESSLRHSVSAAIKTRRRIRDFRRVLRRCEKDPELTGRAEQLVRERVLLVQRLARLKRTRQLFQLWHVFHRPLVWIMFTVFLVHLAVAIYFGYTPFGRG